MVALEYAHQYNRARSLTLYCTVGSGDAVDRAELEALALDAPSSLAGAFSPAFREHDPDLMERIAGWRADEDATGAARDAQANAMTAFDPPPLYEITQPAEVYYGWTTPSCRRTPRSRWRPTCPAGPARPSRVATAVSSNTRRR